MAVYEARFAEAVTGRLLSSLPLGGGSWSDPWAAGGQLRLSLRLRADPRVEQFMAQALPGRTGVWVVRRGLDDARRPLTTCPWAGLYDDDDYDSSTRTLSLTCYQLDAWYDVQELATDYIVAGRDAFHLPRDLVNRVTAEAGGNLRVVADGRLAGRTMDRTYLGSERPKIGELLRALTEVDNGIAYNFDGTVAGTELGFYLRLVDLLEPAPAVSAVPVLFEHPGNLRSYRHTRTGSGIRTGSYDYADLQPAEGQTVGARISTATTNTDLLAAGYPRRITSANRQGVIDTATLAAHGRAVIADSGVPAGALTLTVDPDRPPYGTYPAGTWCRVRIRDARFPLGLDRVCRILQVDGQAAGRGTPEQVTVAVDLG